DELLRHEALARHGADRREHALVADAFTPEVLDEGRAPAAEVRHAAHDCPIRLGLLDGDADEASPLRPGAVVVPHLRVAKEGLEHEPGVRGPLADAAVRDRLLLAGDPLAGVERAQLLRAL